MVSSCSNGNADVAEQVSSTTDAITTTVQPPTTAVPASVSVSPSTEPEYVYVATEDWQNAVAASPTIDVREIADHLDVDYYAALEAIDRRGVYLCDDIRDDPTRVGMTEAMTAAELELGVDFASTTAELATLAATHICPDLAPVVLDFIAETEETASSTTEPAALDQTLSNLLAIGDLRAGKATELRAAIIDFLEQGPLSYWERLNLVSGMIVDASDETEEIPAGIYLVIDATSGYTSDEYQERALFDAVYELATNALWTDEGFGATTDDGNGAVGLDLTADGKRYVLTGDRMLGVRDRRLIVEIAVRGALVR